MFKYKIGEKVIFIDILGNRRIGHIKDCIESCLDHRKVYFIIGLGYPRNEDDIVRRL